MGPLEIVCGALLIVACIVLIIVIVLQETKQDMSGVVTGSSSADSFYGKNKTRTRESTLQSITKYATYIFFALVLLINIFNVFVNK